MRGLARPRSLWERGLRRVELLLARAMAITESPGESRSDRLKNPRTWIVAVLMSALAVLTMFWSPSYWIAVAAAIILPIVVARHPVALVIVIALIAQEVKPGPRTGFATTLGSAAYYTGKVPPLHILVVTAALVAMVRLRMSVDNRPVARSGKAVLGVLAALALLAIVVGLFDGQSPFSAVNQNARPFIIAGVGAVLGLCLFRLSDEVRATAYASGIALVAIALAAAVAVVLDEPADTRVSQYFIFYDSALPAVAIAVAIALLGSGRRRDWRAMLVMAAGLTILVVSFRLAVWIAAAFALALAMMLSRPRLLALRRLAVAAAGLAVAFALTPGLATDISVRVLGASNAAGDGTANADDGAADGSIGDGSAGVPGPAGGGEIFSGDINTSGDVAADSSRGHLLDIKLGWKYATEHLWTGIGPRAPQLPGLAADRAQRIYVHNEWLLDWLRFGPLAALLVTALFAIMAGTSLRTLRRAKSSTTERAAAVFGLMVPVCLMASPFLSTSNRWPLLIGVSAGILCAPAAVGRHRKPVAAT